MDEEPFQVSVGTGTPHGHFSGVDPPALLLHGGAAVTDYMDGCARELARLVRTIRYLQRGTPPSETATPYAIEAPESAAPDPVEHVGAQSSTETNASLSAHYAAGTLVGRLPEVRLPALFVHGERDPLPVRSSMETAELIAGARVEVVPDCGHFVWLERPGELRRVVQSFVEAARA